MNSDARSAEELFFAALERDSAEARADFLDEACGSDPELRQRIERLLDAHVNVGSFLDSPAFGSTLTSDESAETEALGTVIGPYKLIEPIGEGGMGVVYVAEQTRPIRRRVALKVIKPGMDSRQVVARFEAERQALAMMDHSNIAKVLDGGTTQSGRPYFVMELVHGIPITEYCDRERLSIPERLDLFVLVCRAVQHAHQKGIIHRDLKPSNILVTVIDGVAVPKVIDFGVAKATGVSLTEKTIYTAFHQMVGTPLYMSPEQADLSGVDVDTRSDIYSLGVLLYELLTGATPFDSETLKKAAYDEMRRIIREEEPPRPSTRLSTPGEELSAVSAQRKSDPKSLGRSMRGELDWVVMRALEKDRKRRYETASDFAADVMNYLTDRPVEARPPSAWYRLSKYVRRNRVVLTTGTLVGLALIAGTAASAWQAIRATAARRDAEESLATARQTVDEMYSDVAQEWLSKSAELKPIQRKFLEKALAFYERFAAAEGTDPELRIKVANAAIRVGEIRAQLTGLDHAIAPYQQALAILDAVIAEHPDRVDIKRDTAAIHNNLGIKLKNLNRPQDAEREIKKAIAYVEILLETEPKSSLYRDNLAMYQINLGNALRVAGRSREAEEVLRRCCRNFESLTVEDPEHAASYRHNLALTLSNLADLLNASGQLDEAEAEYRNSLNISQPIIDQSDDLSSNQTRGYRAKCFEGLSSLYVRKGRNREAIEASRQAVETFVHGRTRLAHNPGFRLRHISILLRHASLLQTLNELSEAEASFRLASSVAEESVAAFPGRSDLREFAVDCNSKLGDLLLRLDRNREIGSVIEKCVEHLQHLVTEHPGNDRYRNALILEYCRLADHYSTCPEPMVRNPRRALELSQKAIKLSQEKDGIASQSLGWARYRLGDWEGCIESLARQKRFSNEGDYFGAMAYWYLDNKAKARDLFDKQDKWLAGYEKRWNPDVYPEPALLRRIRVEAAALLGVKPGRAGEIKKSATEFVGPPM